MRATIVITKREFGAYFKSPIAYIVLTLFLLLSGILFFEGLFKNGQASMDGYFGNLTWIFAILGPAIAMRLLAEERGSGTIELLLTMPVREWELVLGKYLGAMGMLAVGVLLTVPYAITVAKLGPLDTGPVIGGYVASLLLGGTYLAVGLFASALTRNQIVAFMIALFVCLFLFFLGIFVAGTGSTTGAILEYISPGHHFEAISRGVIEYRNIVYYLSTIGVLLLLTVQVLESRKWR
jgi:ABC-2 type transport system permease protein